MKINLERFIRFIHTVAVADEVLYHVAGFRPDSKEVRMYPHDGGVDVCMPGPAGCVNLGRYWVYVNVRAGKKMEYDAAWWKVLQAAALKGVDPEELGVLEL